MALCGGVTVCKKADVAEDLVLVECWPVVVSWAPVVVGTGEVETGEWGVGVEAGGPAGWAVVAPAMVLGASVDWSAPDTVEVWPWVTMDVVPSGVVVGPLVVPRAVVWPRVVGIEVVGAKVVVGASVVGSTFAIVT